ncbi:ABC transporter ATP-binding protein [Luteibacter yeojuensis]|uniref:ABC transporter ATP-binding protein n=1 Tax=Luteibacter yeojuensis TaxID=345309 RepID=A0A7X5QWB6_9GAMM|nr:ABC transporter ATP-binding protein [Luteibacter yeojuensis]NID16529.1 ABC transporter ATP-binding protein [Luteibacter yeojuensis]
MTALIELRDVARVFRTETVETHALRGVSMDVRAGEFVALTGPSGCGKSTLLNLLGLLDSPSTGTYRLNGVDVGSMGFDDRARERNRSIGFVFQAFQLIPELSVLDNVMLPARYAERPPEHAQDVARQLLERVGIAHRAGHLPTQLSGGQQQRVAIARAMFMSPALLLLDEPTGNLDAASGRAIMDLVGELHEGGTTVVLVTHEPSFAARAARVVHLLDGVLEHAH